jgi:undecaprenyl-diphosphatase
MLHAPPDALDVVLLAVTQGLTEFLPVSSDGHLVLLGSALGVAEGGLSLIVALHVGTLIATFVVYRKSVAEVLRGLFSGEPRMAILIVIGSIPAGLVGVLFEDWFEARFGEPRTAAWGLLATAAVLFLSEILRVRHKNQPPRWMRSIDALLIGIGQAVAILPGVSRSGCTIGAALALGIEPAESARFSFLLALVAVGGAALLKARGLLGAEDPTAPSVGLILMGIAISGVVGYFALRLLITYLSRGILRWFAAYCTVVGTAYLLFA